MKKLRNTAGFSMVETMLAVALVGLMCVIVGGGTITVKNAYDRMVKKENAVTLCSTIEMKLESELRNAEYKDTLADGTIVFISHSNSSYKGMSVGIALDPLTNVILMHFYTREGTDWKDMNDLSGDKQVKPVPILPADTFTDGLIPTLVLTYDDSAMTYYFKVEVKSGDDSTADPLSQTERTITPKY